MTKIPQNPSFEHSPRITPSIREVAANPISSPVPAAPQPTDDDDVIDLGALFSAIWRGKWVIGIITTLAIFFGGYYAFVTAVPLYRSTAVVILETKQDSIVDLQSVVGGMTGDTSEVNSEVEVMRSRGLMGKVVDQLDRKSVV